MTTHTRFTMILICCLFLSLRSQAMADTQAQVNTFIEAWQQVIWAQDTDAALDLIHPDVPKAEVDLYKTLLTKRFSEYASAHPTMTVRHCTESQDKILVQATITLSPPNQPASEKHILYGLKAQGNRLLIWTTLEEAALDQFNAQTRLLTSKKGQFTLSVPQNWYAAKPVGPLVAISAGSAILIGPDLDSTLVIGVVQLPMKIADTDQEVTRIAAQSDVAATKRLTQAHQVVSQGPVVLDGKDAYMIQTQFKVKASDTKIYRRTRYYIHNEPMIYFFLCDTFDLDNTETMTQDFDTIMHSFKVLPREPGISLQETMAAQQGEGSVTGQVYTSKSFNCFMAAPDGWTVRTSPNPSHLVEMQYNEGKSIARLISRKDLPDTLSLENLVTQHAQGLEKATKNYQCLSSKSIVFNEQDAIEEISTYTLESFATFQEKSVYLVHNNTYYIILCQCIEPDDYATLEADFDQIIQSFGFIQ